MESKIQINPYVLIEGSNKDKLSNKLTGEKVLCGEKIIEIVKFLREPKDFEEVEEKFHDTKDELSQLLNTLIEKKFIFEIDRSEEVVTTIFPCNPHLFNLPYPSKDKIKALKKKGVAFIGVPLGIGNQSNNSSSTFPNSIRNYTEKYGIRLDSESFFNINSFGNTDEYITLLDLKSQGRLFDMGNMFFDRNESSMFCYEKISKISKNIFNESSNLIPFFIGGDHSISYPIIQSAIEKYGDDLCVLHFDAHTDTYNSVYNKINHQKKVHHHGNFLSKCFEDGLRHAYQFGIRGTANCNQKTGNKQTIYWASETKKLIKDGYTFEELPKDKKYYITFDFDVLDPLFFSGTTTPVINGFTIEECQYLIENILKDKTIIGADIVELYPNTGNLHITHQMACQFIFNLLNGIVDL